MIFLFLLFIYGMGIVYYVQCAFVSFFEIVTLQPRTVSKCRLEKSEKETKD